MPIRKGSKSFAKQQCASQHPPKHVARIYADQDCDGPLLPLAVPVQRDWHGAQPCTQEATQETTVALIEGGLEASQAQPGSRIDAVDHEQREGGENGQVCGGEEGVGGVGE